MTKAHSFLITVVVCLAVALSLSAQQSPINPKAVALLRWYPANLTTAFPTGGREPGAVAFDGANIWVVNALDSEVSKLRPSDGAILLLDNYRLTDLGGGIAFDGANIWLTMAEGGIFKLRASDGWVLGTFYCGYGSYSVAFDGADIWVKSIQELMKLRVSDGSILLRLEIQPAFCGGLVFDGSNIWAANCGSDTVTKLRASDGTILGTFPTGSSPQTMVFDGANIWVANSGDNTVSKLRASDGATLGTFPLGANSSAIWLAFDGANIWVSGGNAVTKLRASDGANLGTFQTNDLRTYGLAFDGANIWVAAHNNDCFYNWILKM